MPESLPPEMVQQVKDWVVMLVDDHIDNTVVAQTVLEFYGATVHTARNGRECLRLMETIRPTVILLDLSMPVQDGWETLRTIRRTPQTAHIPVIAITAHAMADDRQRVLSAGFSAYLAKPYDVNALIPFIFRTVEQESDIAAHDS